MAEDGWNTIDSDAGVFTELTEKLQVKDVQFDELYSIDNESLMQLEPVHGVIFLFKYSSIDKNTKGPLHGEFDTDYQSKNIFFANQTINNACATQAVLNTLLNKEKEIDIGSELKNFKSFVLGFDAPMIGETISNSDLIRSVHNSFSSPSLFVDDKDSNNQNHDEKNDGLFHFVSYLRLDNHIYELDGLKQYPIKHTKCESTEEFCQKLPEVVRERISKYGGELRFSLLAITNNKLDYFTRIGDHDSVSNELRKREVWKRENELRRHDFAGLLIALIKNISKESSDEDWDELLNNARKRGQARLLSRYSNV